MEEIVCFVCGSNKTYERSRNNKTYSEWRIIDGKKICKNCYDKSDKHKKFLKEYRKSETYRTYRKSEKFLKWQKSYHKNSIEFKELHKKLQKKYEANNPEKIKARQRANYLELRLNFCEKCGIKNVRLENHHPDYSKPELIITLCVKCHNEIHNKKAVA